MLYDGKPVDSVFVAQPLATKDWVRIAAYFDLPALARVEFEQLRELYLGSKAAHRWLLEMGMACLAFVAEAESNWGMVEGYQHTRAQVDYFAERLTQIQDGLKPDSRYPSREYQLISHLANLIERHSGSGVRIHAGDNCLKAVLDSCRVIDRDIGQGTVRNALIVCGARELN